MSFVPGPVGGVGTVFGILGEISSDRDDNVIVDFDSRTSFINGAKSEILKINSIKAEFQKNNNLKDDAYIEFLDKQINLLKNEIDKNTKYDKQQLGKIDYNLYKVGQTPYKDKRFENPESYVKNIDYYSIYKGQKIDE